MKGLHLSLATNLAVVTFVTVAKIQSSCFVSSFTVPSHVAHHRVVAVVADHHHPAFRTTRSMPVRTADTTGRTDLTMMMVDPATVVDGVTTLAASSSSDVLLSFADQGQNLAGIFFQASLLPYLGFLYFLGYKGNRTPALGNFGFQFLLLFVLSTIPSGLVAKGTYGVTLADADWLHGSSESLLTVTNILIVLGFRNASTQIEQIKIGTPRIIALSIAATVAAAIAYGSSLGFEAHSAFLLGAGNVPTDVVTGFPWVMHNEPINGLSLPTWAIHFSSVFEFLFAMGIIWDYAKVTDNERWKGLTWGMLPAHASGLAACTYHFFYNTSELQFVVTTQAGLTLLGNITLLIAAFRIAQSNGWTVGDLNPLPKSNTSPDGIITDSMAVLPLQVVAEKESDVVLAAKLAALTFIASYVVKYGELGLDVPFAAENPNKALATAMVFAPAALTATVFYGKSQDDGGFKNPFAKGEDGEGGLSMADVKKYGVSGTVAYVLTELAFWAVAFPVASTALYQSTGHWPDVINDTTDRTTVLGFIFAGANVARLLVPVRLGAALALAPWVDENIVNRDSGTEDV